MTLPPWNPETEAERRAFIDRVHDELMAERLRAGAAAVPLLQDVIFAGEATKRGFHRAPKRGRRFTKDRNTPLEQAKADARLLGPIFRRVWSESNRHTDPSRTRILADIWKLSSEDEAELERHITGGKNG